MWSVAGEMPFEIDGLPVSQSRFVPQGYFEMVIVFHKGLEVISD